GGSVDWGAKTLSHELSAMSLSLGLLKSGSALGHRLNAGFAPGSIGSRLSARLLPQAMAGTALFAAHRIESLVGLRPPSDAASALFDSAAMLLQFHVGGRLLHAATGGALSRALGELRIRSRLSAEPRFPEGPQPASGLEYAGVLARHGGRSPFLPPRHAASKWQAESNHMSALADNGGANGFLNRRLIQRMGQALGVAETDSRLQSIAENYWNTPFHFKQPEARGTYFDMLSRSELVGTTFLEAGREVAAVDLMQSASLILRRAMEMNPFRGGSGSFYDFLTQVAFEQTLQSQRIPAFDALIHTLTVKQSQAALENFFQQQQLHLPFERQRFDRRFRPMDHAPVLRALEAFPVSDKIRFWLAEYLLSYNQGVISSTFRNPIYNHYYVDSRGKREAVPVLEEGVFQSLREIFAEPRNHSVWQHGLEQLVRRAQKSPVPMLYFDRFFKLLGSGDLLEKISELVIGAEFNPLEVWQGIPIDGTVYTGYIFDKILSDKFRDFYRALPELLHPLNSEARLAEFRLKAGELLQGRENFDADQILELLFHRPTARAAEVRRAILDGKVGLEVLTAEGMEILMKSLRPDRPIGKLHDALYLPASRSPTGLPYIAILQLDPKLSREEKIARAVFLTAYTVHEYEHHLHLGELDINQRGQRLVAEMRGWLEENLLLMTQGEKTVWEEAEVVSPTGFGVYLRSLIERAYLHEDHDYLQKRP
ncbi:MAG TPA: hypothetical protein VJP40_01995, partial [bacterium]|nr:hypothetical protein [bacterium]